VCLCVRASVRTITWKLVQISDFCLVYRTAPFKLRRLEKNLGQFRMSKSKSKSFFRGFKVTRCCYELFCCGSNILSLTASRDATHSANYAVARCPSVCPFVRLSVCHTPVLCRNSVTIMWMRRRLLVTVLLTLLVRRASGSFEPVSEYHQG